MSVFSLASRIYVSKIILEYRHDFVSAYGENLLTDGLQYDTDV